MTLTECRLRPFELLELQETARFLRIPRRVYLDTYWESPVEVRTRGGGELQGLEGIKKLATIEREEKVQQELQRDLVTEFVSNPADEAREEPRGAAASMILGWKNTPDARAKEHEEKRRKLLQKAEQEETKRQQREIKEAATEKWKERLAIVEGHQLNVWKNRDDDYPEQSWDLRRAVEVSGMPSSSYLHYKSLTHYSSCSSQTVETTRIPARFRRGGLCCTQELKRSQRHPGERKAEVRHERRSQDKAATLRSLHQVLHPAVVGQRSTRPGRGGCKGGCKAQEGPQEYDQAPGPPQLCVIFETAV